MPMREMGMKKRRLERPVFGWHPWMRARRSRSWQKMKRLWWILCFLRIVERVGLGESERRGN